VLPLDHFKRNRSALAQGQDHPSILGATRNFGICGHTSAFVVVFPFRSSAERFSQAFVGNSVVCTVDISTVTRWLSVFCISLPEKCVRGVQQNHANRTVFVAFRGALVVDLWCLQPRLYQDRYIGNFLVHTRGNPDPTKWRPPGARAHLWFVKRAWALNCNS
jgi:hypothetical protein